MESPRQEAQASSSHRSCDHGDGDGGGGDRVGFDRPAELMSVDQCDSKLVGAPIAVAGGLGGGGAVAAAAMEVKTAEKRKRGRPPRGGQGTTTDSSRRTTPATATAEEEEDVCFICFDGGSLVLCDRRNCPKAYHPACIKRDESFFRSRAKWNCGWHICSTCMKSSHYLCYTCTYSLCKRCTKDADYVCVRGNKGFCGTCKRTILLIENFEGNKEGPQVDFDDKTSWEYLFKVYWVLLKGNLSLTLDELLQAKNPWKAPAVSVFRWGFSGGLYGVVKDKSAVSADSFPDQEVLNAKRRKINTKTNVLITENSLGIEKHSGDTVTHLNGNTNWATKELLEFVAHMRNGDTSLMSEFDVQNLLLEYIKKNNLRDPLQKCQIVCDSRLFNMFGQARLGHIEMLKLLESHVLIKDEPSVNDTFMAGLGVGEAVGSQIESSWDCNGQMTTINDKKRKLRKRVDEKGLPNNPNAYARIDAHNIELIYLRRCLLENLVDNAENFHEKVVGSIVRIQISSSDQRPDMHRLVRVVGTSKGAVPYKIGTRETNLMLDILNLDKKEVMAIDKISNQEFSEDECERLRQSIKFGLIKRLTVGEIQEKAIALQEVKLNDWLEAEILRLNHLRDRASEKGHSKDLSECMEKLELLNSPDERKRMLEVPIVHSDPSMDPSYDFDHNPSELHQNKQDADYKAKPRNSGVARRKRESTPAKKSRQNKTLGINSLNTLKHEVDSTDSGTNQSVNDWEMHKIWHYQDPTGKIQGPFSMLQLRTWSICGHFPPHLRIWRLKEKPEDSILLTDALDGLCSKEQLLPINSTLPLQEQKGNAVSDDRKNNADGSGQSKSVNVTPVNGENVEQSVNLELNDQPTNLDGSTETADTDGLGSNPASSTTVAVANSSDGNSINLSKGLDSLNGNNVLPTQPQVSISLSTLVFPENQTPSDEINEDRTAERNSDQSENVWQNADPETINNQGSENRSDGEGQSDQSSGQSWRPPVSSPINKDSDPPAKPLETSEQQTGVDFPTLPNVTPKPSNESSEGQDEENNKQSASPSILPVQDAGLSWSTASSLVGRVGGESGGYSSGPAKPSVEEWESSLVSVSSLKPREIAGDHVMTPASISDHLTPSSPSHPHSNTSSWHDILPDPDEFSSLMNESVSDLLAEVEAMESLHALSCHMVVNSGSDLAQGSRTDCISLVEGFSPAPQPGKGDALSSTVDIHLASQPNVIDEPILGVGERSPEARHNSVSPETEGDAKHSEVSVNQWEGSADIQPVAAPAPEPEPEPAVRWNVEITDVPWNASSESMNPNWGSVQENTNTNTDATTNTNLEVGLDQGNEVMDWNRTPAARQNGNNSRSVAPPTGGILGSQPRHGGDRYSPRDRVYHGSRDSGFSQNRHSWNRQPYFGGGSGGGASYRAPPKGQRVCKFYESGYCKRGSSCSFFHP